MPVNLFRISLVSLHAVHTVIKESSLFAGSRNFIAEKNIV